MKLIIRGVKAIIISSLLILALGCGDKHTHIHEEHSDFEVIDHACIHMSDSGVVVNAESSMPGPHLNKEDFAHKLLRVALVTTAAGEKEGYIHFGPAITGDMVVVTNEDVPISVTNRTASGDTSLEIENTYTAQQIADSTGCPLIKKAIVFEARTGGNIIKLGPTTFDTISVIIEEGSHGHSH